MTTFNIQCQSNTSCLIIFLILPYIVLCVEGDIGYHIVENFDGGKF